MKKDVYGGITLYNADCMDIMRAMPDKAFDLAIVDPPYGIDINPNMGLAAGAKKRHKAIEWDKAAPPIEYFDELFRVSKNQIIWGGNYFPLPPCRHFIFWDKLVSPGLSFSDGEMAWTSFDRAIRKYTQRNIYDGKIHPTQKPVELYGWLLRNYARPGDKILDTHLGSGSICIACHDLGFEMTGIELDKDYYEAASKRLRAHQMQQVLF